MYCGFLVVARHHTSCFGLVDLAQLCPCHPFVQQLQNAQQLHVEVVVGLAAARSVEFLVAPRRAVP